MRTEKGKHYAFLRADFPDDGTIGLALLALVDFHLAELFYVELRQASILGEYWIVASIDPFGSVVKETEWTSRPGGNYTVKQGSPVTSPMLASAIAVSLTTDTNVRNLIETVRRNASLSPLDATRRAAGCDSPDLRCAGCDGPNPGEDVDKPKA